MGDPSWSVLGLGNPILQSLGKLTFNNWALAAYHKVFCYERPVGDLVPEVAALSAATANADMYGQIWWSRDAGDPQRSAIVKQGG